MSDAPDPSQLTSEVSIVRESSSYLDIALPAVGVAFAAFCVWLIVRILNRRERWAKWTLTLAVGLPALYVLSFGPACWIDCYTRTALGHRFVWHAYRPLFWLIVEGDHGLWDYAGLGIPDGAALYSVDEVGFRWFPDD